jgi:antitoxin (DNA-binding transcriptional repressor) of toxin-antitoxin stability system
MALKSNICSLSDFLIIIFSDIQGRAMTRISATEASRNFSDILNRTLYRGENFEVTRNGEVIARIEPVLRSRMTLGEILDRLDRLPGLDPEDARLFEEQIAQLRREATLPESQWE